MRWRRFRCGSSRSLRKGVAAAGMPRPVDLDDMAAILPEGLAEAATVNAAAMELGAVVCTARQPRCDECPIAQWCEWRGAGYPDFRSYVDTQYKVDDYYRQPEKWRRSALINIANMGYFSSDRSIQDYADGIWHIKPLTDKELPHDPHVIQQ